MNTTRKQNHSAFTLVEIMIVVAIIGLLAAMAIPNFVKARATSQKQACINNLRQLDGAKQQWAMENAQQSTALAVNSDLTPYLAGARFPAEPAGGSYTIGNLATLPTCDQAVTAGHTF